MSRYFKRNRTARRFFGETVECVSASGILVGGERGIQVSRLQTQRKGKDDGRVLSSMKV